MREPEAFELGAEAGAEWIEAVAKAGDFDAAGALTREFLLRRGHCCHEGCIHCPYDEKIPANAVR